MNFDEYFEQHDMLTYTFKGVSMMPMLRQDTDTITVLRKKEALAARMVEADYAAERFRVNDVVLYKRRGRYVLHRIVQVRENDYVIIGDNCVNYEYGITDNDILGMLVLFTHDGKEYPVDDEAYLNYVDKLSTSRDKMIARKKAYLNARRKIGSLTIVRKVTRLPLVKKLRGR